MISPMLRMVKKFVYEEGRYASRSETIRRYLRDLNRFLEQKLATVPQEGAGVREIVTVNVPECISEDAKRIAELVSCSFSECTRLAVLVGIVRDLEEEIFDRPSSPLPVYLSDMRTFGAEIETAKNEGLPLWVRFHTIMRSDFVDPVRLQEFYAITENTPITPAVALFWWRRNGDELGPKLICDEYGQILFKYPPEEDDDDWTPEELARFNALIERVSHPRTYLDPNEESELDPQYTMHIKLNIRKAPKFPVIPLLTTIRELYSKTPGARPRIEITGEEITGDPIFIFHAVRHQFNKQAFDEYNASTEVYIYPELKLVMDHNDEDYPIYRAGDLDDRKDLHQQAEDGEIDDDAYIEKINAITPVPNDFLEQENILQCTHHPEFVFFTREEAEAFAARNTLHYPSGRNKGPHGYHIYSVNAMGLLAELLKLPEKLEVKEAEK